MERKNEAGGIRCFKGYGKVRDDVDFRPTAREVADKLRDWGLDDNMATNSLNLAGHSFGTYINREIAFELQGANLFLALDPATDAIIVDGKEVITRYNLDGNGIRNTPYMTNSYFSGISQFARSFVGGESVAGNKKLSASADESYIVDFEKHNVIEQHGWTKDAIAEMYNQLLMFKDSNGNTLFDIDKGAVPSNTINRNTTFGRHEGIVYISNIDDTSSYGKTTEPIVSSLKVINSDTDSLNCTGDQEKSTMYGTIKSDIITADLSECSMIYGWEGDDTIRGNNNSTVVEAGDGNDTIRGSSFRYFYGNLDKVSGGSGDDTFVVMESNTNTSPYGGENRHVVIEDFGDGDDRITLSRAWENEYTIEDDGTKVKILLQGQLITSVEGVGAPKVTNLELSKGVESTIFNFN